MYRTWDKMESDERQKILAQAEKYLNAINDL
jgi:deoxyribodipyrimidine photolyase-related protein